MALFPCIITPFITPFSYVPYALLPYHLALPSFPPGSESNDEYLFTSSRRGQVLQKWSFSHDEEVERETFEDVIKGCDGTIVKQHLR